VAEERQRVGRDSDKRAFIGRRQLLLQGAKLSAAGALIATGCSTSKTDPGLLADRTLIRASALSGEPLSAERVKAMKPMLEFTLKHLEVLREFDPDEEEPPTIFKFGKD